MEIQSYSSFSGQEIPSGLKYNRRMPDTIPARMRIVDFTPTAISATYSYSTNRNIIIPIMSDGFGASQDAKLSFKVSSTADKITFIDHSGHSIIRTLKIVGANGKIIEEIQDYNSKVALLSDLYLSYDYLESVVGNIAGYAGCTAITEPTMVANTGTHIYSLTLFSAFLNTIKYLPLHKVQQLYIQIELEEPTRCLKTHEAAVTAGSVNYTVSNIKYSMPIINISDEGNKIFDAGFSAGLIKFDGTTYISSQVPMNIANGMLLQYSLNAKSVKSLFMIMNDTAKTSSNYYRTFGRRLYNGVSSYAFRINGNQLKTVNISASSGAYGIQDAISELQKCTGTGNNIHNVPYRITESTYINNTDPAGTAVGNADQDVAFNKFVICQDLEAFNGADNIRNTGVNTNGQQIILDLKCSGAVLTTLTTLIGACDIQFSFLPTGEIIADV